MDVLDETIFNASLQLNVGTGSTSPPNETKTISCQGTWYNISPAWCYVMTRGVWHNREKMEKQMMLSVSVLPRKCLGFTSGAVLKPNPPLEALYARKSGFICCITKRNLS